MFEVLGTSRQVVTSYEVTISRDVAGRYSIKLFRETVGDFLHELSNRRQLGELVTTESPLLWQIESLVYPRIGFDETTYKNVLERVKSMLWEHQCEDETVTWAQFGAYRISFLTMPCATGHRSEFRLFEQNDFLVSQVMGVVSFEPRPPTIAQFAIPIASRWAIDHETLMGLINALEATGCFATTKTEPAP